MINAGIVGWSFAIAAVAAGAGERPRQGVLVMAHGGDEDWNRDVEAVAAPLRSNFPTEIAFGMAVPSAIEEAVTRLEEQGVRDIAVVRMFVSGESFLPATEYIFGLRDTPPAAAHGQPDHDAGHEHGDHGDAHGGHSMEPPRRIQSRSTFVLSRDGVGRSPLIDDILMERVRALSDNPRSESVLILAHGPGDDAENERWIEAMERRVEKIRRAAPFREVRCETLREDWPEKRATAEQKIRSFVEQANREGGRCLVIPFRVAGFGPYREVLEGLSYTSDGRGFCPHPLMTAWLEQTARQCFAQEPTPSRAAP
jgi:hypothetical protein